MKVKKVKVIRCPNCEEFFLPEDMPEEETFYRCGECEGIYEDREEAKKCCRED